MWYIECACCGDKIWEGQEAFLADTNEGVGRRPFCDQLCFEDYSNTSIEKVHRTVDSVDEFVWKEDKRRKRLPE